MIGLDRIEGSHSQLATQHWESRAAYDEALPSADYVEWQKAYAPALDRWHEMMTFEEAWETLDLRGQRSARPA